MKAKVNGVLGKELGELGVVAEVMDKPKPPVRGKYACAKELVNSYAESGKVIAFHVKDAKKRNRLSVALYKFRSEKKIPWVEIRSQGETMFVEPVSK